MIPNEIQNLWEQASDMALDHIRKEARKNSSNR